VTEQNQRHPPHQAPRYYAGIDIGAITAKAVILGDAGLLAVIVVPAGYNRSQAAEQVLAMALIEAGLQRDAISRLVATGYGRVQVPGADRTVTEITCHARGAHWLCPQVGTVIDIGGQDSKAIAVAKQGKVLDFVMNDKCAAGTGRFLEVMARALEVDLDQFGALATAATQPAKISSTCTVFAESEVVSHLAAGTPREEIVAGIHASIAARLSSMVGRIPLRDQVVLTGGVARNLGVVRAIEARLARPVLVPESAQAAGAIGAALIARDMDRDLDPGENHP
jgi:(R)-2-hydroxyacyl-CoA dehydratese activating ATPase